MKKRRKWSLHPLNSLLTLGMVFQITLMLSWALGTVVSWFKSLTNYLICLLQNLLETLISCDPRVGAKWSHPMPDAQDVLTPGCMTEPVLVAWTFPSSLILPRFLHTSTQSQHHFSTSCPSTTRTQVWKCPWS